LSRFLRSVEQHADAERIAIVLDHGTSCFQVAGRPTKDDHKQNVVIFLYGSSQAGGFRFALSLTIPAERPVNGGSK